MGQVTIYLDDETETKARAAAQASGLSLSRWVAERVRLGALSEWPAEVMELAGAWSDIPSAQQLRRSRTRDAKRTRL
ncbi:MAG TPA: CopG family transcriptional regulator [Burkholderiales bacterium]|nr:CopG family transcriptional regulator [Burkholderiales bacterium]